MMELAYCWVQPWPFRPLTEILCKRSKLECCSCRNREVKMQMQNRSSENEKEERRMRGCVW
ncbi:hypothetical protein LINGRAHAP2_LOCUS27849 [Linum grandiflorum]